MNIEDSVLRELDDYKDAIYKIDSLLGHTHGRPLREIVADIERLVKGRGAGWDANGSPVR